MYSFKRILATLLNNSDQNISGEEYTGQVSATVANLAARGFEEVENIGGTAIALTGDIAKDSANFTYFQGKPLFFKAVTKSAGAASIDIAGKGAIPIKDAKGGVITKDSWHAGELVYGVIYNNQLIVFVNNTASNSNDQQSSNVIQYATIVDYYGTELAEDQTLYTFTNYKGVAGDIIFFPKMSFFGNVQTSDSISSSLYFELHLYQDSTFVHKIEYVGIVSQQGDVHTRLNELYRRYNAIVISDDQPHDYSIRFEILNSTASKGAFIYINGDLEVKRLSGPVIT